MAGGKTASALKSDPGSEDPRGPAGATKVASERSRDIWLLELAPRIVRLQDLAMRELDPAITFGQFRLLQRVAEGRNTLTAISNASTLSTPTLSERIESTVRKGLLRRKTVPGDRRASLLELTPLGLKCMADAKQRLERLSEWMLRHLDIADYEAFSSYGRALDAKLIAIHRKLLESDAAVSEAIARGS